MNEQERQMEGKKPENVLQRSYWGCGFTAEGHEWCFITLRVIYRLTGEFHYQRAKNSPSAIPGLNRGCEPTALLCLRIKMGNIRCVMRLAEESVSFQC